MNVVQPFVESFARIIRGNDFRSTTITGIKLNIDSWEEGQRELYPVITMPRVVPWLLRKNEPNTRHFPSFHMGASQFVTVSIMKLNRFARTENRESKLKSSEI